MEKPKLKINEIIHEGATVCFDWLEYLNGTPPEYSFGLDENLWKREGKLDKFNKVQGFHIKAVKYIKSHKIDKNFYSFEFQDKYLKDKHYLTLSVMGNEIEYIFLSQMTNKELIEHFEGEDYYYASDDVRKAIEFAKATLNALNS